MTERRLHCCNPRCSRTSKAGPDDGPNAEICCSKCWKLLPRSLVARYRALKRRDKKVGRLFARERRLAPEAAAAGIVSHRMQVVGEQMDRAFDANWHAIRTFFRPIEKPDGLDAFLEEVGL
jgi:hypothetical protein